MTRTKILEVAKELADAVESKLITEDQARNRFKVALYKYRQASRFSQLQNDDPLLWATMSSLISYKKEGK